MKSFILFFNLIFFFSCTTKGKFEIRNVEQDTVIKIFAKSTPSNFKLKIEGQVDDSFSINNVIVGGGKINHTISFDWYNKNVILNYKAYKAKKGKLTFKYNIPGYF